MSKQEPTYYGIITAPVRYDKSISPHAKVLYAELTALSQKKGYCWSSNKFFSELYGVSTSTISRWVTELRRARHITVEVIQNKVKGGAERKIRIIKDRR